MLLTLQKTTILQPPNIQKHLTIIQVTSYKFPMHLFVKSEAECVDELPHDIDGFKLYKIKCSQQEWVEKSQDLQHFKMNTSRRKDLIGTRKVGRCLGSLYCMSAHCPFKCSAEGQPNTMNFQNVSGHNSMFQLQKHSKEENDVEHVK